MPTLDNIIRTEKVKLPVTGAEVDIKTMFTGAEEDALGENFDKKTPMVAMAVKSWNLTDASGKTLPVTEENVSKLPNFDRSFILEKFLQFIQKGREQYGLIKDEEPTDDEPTGEIFPGDDKVAKDTAGIDDVDPVV